VFHVEHFFICGELRKWSRWMGVMAQCGEAKLHLLQRNRTGQGRSQLVDSHAPKRWCDGSLRREAQAHDIRARHVFAASSQPNVAPHSREARGAWEHDRLVAQRTLHANPFGLRPFVPTPTQRKLATRRRYKFFPPHVLIVPPGQSRQRRSRRIHAVTAKQPCPAKTEFCRVHQARA